MAPRLADVIEEYLHEAGPHVSVRNGDVLNEHKFAEGLEQHLQDSFVILPKTLEGKN